MISSLEITGLLVDWSNGDEVALEKLLPLVEKELHRLAHRQLRKMQPGNTLQTTALINETYLVLIKQNQVHWQNRAHFFGIAARLMRRILLNYLRDGQRLKRGGNAVRVSLSEATAISEAKADEFIALDDALEKLALFDERKSRVVELKFFGGLNVEEIAEVLKISNSTVVRDWVMAKAWLAREISDGNQ
ncbi:MAG: sigma-70 family RNA polymerase sigma factor [Pyrinomonadaceae bacterium]|nr:sigma-70 family RNA polymerase sigma factor [Pyrinomonadaceae bacterium]